MRNYMQRHEEFVRSILERPEAELGRTEAAELLAFHREQIGRMQHERLIHLVVTLFVATFLLLVLGFVTSRPSAAGLALVPVLLALTAAYLVHYFRLENGVQRWYHLANRLASRAGERGARYDEDRVTPFGPGIDVPPRTARAVSSGPADTTAGGTP